MLNIAICDDEPVILDSILKNIKTEFDKLGIKTQIEGFTDGLELLSKASSEDFDVLFLDIELKTANGVDIAKKLREDGYNNMIVFITSFINYAVDGYKLDVFRFILKSNMEVQLKECIISIAKNIDKNNIRIKSRKITIEDILYVMSENHKIIIHLKNGEKLSDYMKLDEFKEKLNSKFFLRIHQSYLVNSNYVRDIIRYELTLHNEEKLPIAKSRYKETSKEVSLRRALWH